MGCSDSSQYVSSSADSLKALVIKQKYICEIEKERTRLELEKLQKFLCQQFSKPLKSRSKQLEHSMITNNLTYFAKMHILLMVQNSSKVLQEHSTYFEDESKLHLFKPSLDLVLYCSTFLEKQDFMKFSLSFKSVFPRYPFPSDNDIADDLIKQYKLDRSVSFQVQKEYIFELSNRSAIPTDSINLIGHNYKYSATRYE